MTERKLDIFRVLKQADLKNADFFEKLTEEEQKAFQPFLIQRWMSGTYSPRQIVFLNELVNPFAFSLANHKQLLWQLMTICTGGKPQRYVWNKLPGKLSTAKPVSVSVIQQYLQCSERHAHEALNCLTGNDILNIAEKLGMQTEELAKIRKEHKDEELKADTIGAKSKNKTKPAPEKEAVQDFFQF
ncbi:MAG: hypothetical protein E4H14_03645 [Candidatus Thorarchaeota archaeon]|nr:MAG: hypothetical protein E4H14_03645 [Candidatus Thorarchaeota archaeon]